MSENVHKIPTESFNFIKVPPPINANQISYQIVFLEICQQSCFWAVLGNVARVSGDPRRSIGACGKPAEQSESLAAESPEPAESSEPAEPALLAARTAAEPRDAIPERGDRLERE